MILRATSPDDNEVAIRRRRVAFGASVFRCPHTIDLVPAASPQHRGARSASRCWGLAAESVDSTRGWEGSMEGGV